jgi:hypothetical protein
MRAPDSAPDALRRASARRPRRVSIADQRGESPAERVVGALRVDLDRDPDREDREQQADRLAQDGSSRDPRASSAERRPCCTRRRAGRVGIDSRGGQIDSSRSGRRAISRRSAGCAIGRSGWARIPDRARPAVRGRRASAAKRPNWVAVGLFAPRGRARRTGAAARSSESCGAQVAADGRSRSSTRSIALPCSTSNP